MKQPVILRLFKGEQLVEVKQFDIDQIVIGHKAEVNVDLDDVSVSPIHALIEKRDSRFYICDLGSSTGTLKNGQPILDESIESGDEIQIGTYRISFFVGVPKLKSKPSGSQPATLVPPKAVSESVEEPELIHVEEVTKPLPRKSQLPVESIKEEKPKITGGVSIKVGQKVEKRTLVSRGTFAPKSEHHHISDILSASKGPILEVVFTWKERVLDSYHYRGRQVVNVGPEAQNQILVPNALIGKGFPLVDFNGLAQVQIPPDFDFEVISEQTRMSSDDLEKGNRIQKRGPSQFIRLEQGEMLVMFLPRTGIGFVIRYIPNVPSVSLAPVLPFSVGELSGLIVSVMLVLLLGLYVSLNKPTETPEEEKLAIEHTATIIYNRPKPPPLQVPKEVPPPPPPPKPVVVEVKEKPKSSMQAGMAGAASDVAPKPKVSRNKSFTSTKQGGAVRTGPVAGSNAKSANKPTAPALLSVFGSRGLRSQTDTAYSGAGDLIGMAAKATGSSGFAETRSGDDLGSRFKDTGAGGKGVATEGIGGALTKGRGSGTAGYGSDGAGLGGRSAVTIQAGGTGEDFIGSIDREAVRRVVQSKKDAIRRCYEKELKNNPDLSGRILMQWEIIELGQVRNAKVKESTLDNKSVGECLRNELLTWQFPEPAKNVRVSVTFPFLFQKR